MKCTTVVYKSHATDRAILQINSGQTELKPIKVNWKSNNHLAINP